MNHNIFDYHYRTYLPIPECIRKIEQLPWEYECDFGTPLWYRCKIIADTSVLVTFTGGKFRKIKRTQYILDFSSENSMTIVEARFYKELFGMSPMTLATDIDFFMKQKIGAIRITSN